MSIEITVRGSSSCFTPPERATVVLTVAIDGPDPALVSRGVAASAEVVRRSIEALHDPERGPVTWWSSGQVSTWASRPWNQHGKVLPLVHHARVTFSVKFADFTRLAMWLADTIEVSGVSVGGVEWALTEARGRQVLTEVRAAAVADALAKAQTYADAVGAGPVRVLAIADAGMLGEGMHPTADSTPLFARMASAEAGAASINLVPEDVVTVAEVDLRGVAD